ncbi:MAG: relaxase/mobilization nuclease domain-containing protein [Bacteroides sp.]|nr:relaxase/mobilization nuclease domain-containing protein [Eubacterium sp.]MCM1419138.1 relaxase/mobilization nuclease domain-containing protein [Roseburia sp.]MCM1463225.1 relaxase/mobilization nuclease domain-containing protein [Bacteroides sp.]
MATTKMISKIKSTLSRAIDYISNAEKTVQNGRTFISCSHCSPMFAEQDFLRTKEAFDFHSANLAYHFEQSFAPEEVSAELAHEIGKKLCEKWLRGEYQYILATHVDRNHIHNHLIVNSVNCKNGKSFSREHDRKSDPAWRRLREISDELCAEYGLSVIPEPEKGKGKSRYEWEQDEAGNSWKSKLKTEIDECIKTAECFEDFLEKMRERGYEIKQGKHIAFRAEGQERFTRAKTLGFYYSEENIRFRLDRRLMYREQPPKENIGRFVQMDDKVQASEGLRRWAVLQNMQNASKLINQLSEKGIESSEQLRDRLLDRHDRRIDIADEIKSAERELTSLEQEIRILKDYHALLPIYKESSALNGRKRERFDESHKSELIRYNTVKKAAKTLLRENGKLPNIQALQNRVDKLNEKKTALMERYKEVKAEISELERLKKSLDDLERSTPQKERSNERE